VTAVLLRFARLDQFGQHAQAHPPGIALGAALLLLALHYDQQSSKSHMLLVLTAYHRAIMRMLDATRGHLAE